MNSESERRLSMDELKKLNQRDLSMAAQTEKTVTVLESNWVSLIALSRRMADIQTGVLEKLDTLTTEAQLRSELHFLMEQTQELEKEYIESSNKILEDVRAELQSFGKQAGKVSEQLASDSSSLMTECRSQISEMKRAMKGYSIRLTVLSGAALGLLTILSSLLMLLRG